MSEVKEHICLFCTKFVRIDKCDKVPVCGIKTECEDYCPIELKQDGEIEQKQDGGEGQEESKEVKCDCGFAHGNESEWDYKNNHARVESDCQPKGKVEEVKEKEAYKGNPDWFSKVEEPKCKRCNGTKRIPDYSSTGATSPCPDCRGYVTPIIYSDKKEINVLQSIEKKLDVLIEMMRALTVNH